MVGQNIGNFLTVTMSSTSNRAYSPIRVVPQSTAIIPLGASLLRFSTKMMRYELELVQGTPVTEPEVDSLPNAEFTRNTFEPNYEQRRVLEALARPLLKDPSAVPRVVIPSTKELAEELGWGEKKTAQKIQYIAETLQKLGVPEFQEGMSVPWRLLVARFAAENPYLFGK